MIAFEVSRRPVSQDVFDAALAELDHAPGIYFGVDTGVAGLHPLQARLLKQPAICLRLYGDGVEAQAFTALGLRLLARPDLQAWRGQGLRGAGHSPLVLVRSFMAALAPSPDVLVMGALPFAFHQVATGDAGAEFMGVLFLAESSLARDANGNWEQLTLEMRSEAAEDLPSAQSPAAEPFEPTPPEDAACGDDFEPGGYAAMVRRALVHLKQEHLVSLTLSQSYRRKVALSPSAAFRRLRAANPAPASFFLNDGRGGRLFGASPDLQLAITGGMVQSLPVCGTVARRPGAVGEAESLRELLNEDVDAASLAICTDALRNDLAPLCEPGSLRLLDRRRPMSLATVVHTVDRLEGRLRAGSDAWDAIAATAAPVMVTGTPRRHALAAIAQLEASPRGWYGGMVVQVSTAGDALVGTILRAAAVRAGIAEVRTGGDLLADSTPEREEQESRLKSLSLWRAFGLESAGPPSHPDPIAPQVAPAVALMAAGDPFGAALADCLLGLGARIDAQADVTVCAGSSAGGFPSRRAVAIGDAAVRLLEREGFPAMAIRPEQGRPIRCTPCASAPGSAAAPFIAARYLRSATAPGSVQVGWEVWAVDEESGAQVLAHAGRRLVCMLFRPDSLLSEPAARAMLAAALVWCAAGDPPD